VRSVVSHILAAFAATLAGGSMVRGQVRAAPPDEGPIIVGQGGPAWKGFELRRLDAAFEFSGRKRSDRLTQAGGPDQKDAETRFRETLEVSGEVSIGHKNLVDLTGAARVGREDRWITSGALEVSERNTDHLYFYDLNARLLGASRVPLDVYSRRDEQLLDRDFSTSITSTTSETGVIANLVSEVAPTTLRIFRNESDQRDRLGQFNSAYEQDSIALNSHVSLADNQRLEVGATLDGVTESQGGRVVNEFERADLLLGHTLTFGGERRHELRSFLRYFDESGRADQGILRLDEQLHLNHSDRLQSQYALMLERQARGSREQDLARGSASIRHSLFESLVSRGSLTAQRLTTSGGFESTEASVQGTLQYTKRMPRGRLSASLGAAFTTQENSEQGVSRSVINEGYVFNDPFPIVVSRRNIVPGSIVVTATGGFPTYTEGFDYTVRYSADRAEIRVVIGRGIVDGQALLVSYDVGPEPGNRIDTAAGSITVRYSVTEGRLQGLSAYAIYRTRDHGLSSDRPSLIVLDDTTDLTLGMEYQRGGLRLKGEREDHDSSVSPSRTTRLQAFYDRRLGPGSTLSFDASRDEIEYDTPTNRVEFVRLGGRWNHRVGRDLDVHLRLEYRDENDDLGGDSNGLDQIAGFRWRRGQTSVYATVRLTLVESERSETRSELAEFGLRRSF